MVSLMGGFELMGELSGKGVSKGPLLAHPSGEKHKLLGKSDGQGICAVAWNQVRKEVTSQRPKADRSWIVSFVQGDSHTLTQPHPATNRPIP